MTATGEQTRAHAGRVAVITGGASGIGLAIAQRLARDGATVAIVSRDRTKHDAAITSIRIVQDSARVACYRADVSREPELVAALEQARKDLGPIGILINNAGISPKHDGHKAPVRSMRSDEWRVVLDTNLTAAFVAARACITDFEALRWGRIVLISSVAGRARSDLAGAHYAAAKAGLIGLSRILAAELAPLGVTVNCVAPGQIITPMTDERANAEYLPKIPVGRLGVPDDVAAAVAYLTSDEAAFVTGAVLDITGGSFMP
jgi:3-oxoacyl-[acyl-carrier protein] reductase